MKKLIITLFFGIIIFMFGIPLAVLNGFSEPARSLSQASSVVRLLDKNTGAVKYLPLEEYLVGVVAAEMPAKFHLEALKAQAVAARTYTVKRMFDYGAKPNPDHPGGEVCTDPGHCQAWIDSTEQRKRWGLLQYFVQVNQITKAVELTKGQVIAYNKVPIDPVYHGSCGGKGTENSEDVWSYAIPYLRGVDCKSEYKAEQQIVSNEFNREKIFNLVRSNQSEVLPALTNQTSLFGPAKKSPQGRLREIQIYGQVLTGTELRKILGLSSTMVTWQETGSKIRFTSVGKGHAVGLCQYGANGMALVGRQYREILLHYYTGVKIQKLKY